MAPCWMCLKLPEHETQQEQLPSNPELPDQKAAAKISKDTVEPAATDKQAPPTFFQKIKNLLRNSSHS